MITISELWSFYDVWNNARVVSAYTKRAALRCQTKALIAMDKATSN